MKYLYNAQNVNAIFYLGFAILVLYDKKTWDFHTQKLVCASFSTRLLGQMCFSEIKPFKRIHHYAEYTYKQFRDSHLKENGQNEKKDVDLFTDKIYIKASRGTGAQAGCGFDFNSGK